MDMWDYSKRYNIHAIWIPKEEEKDSGAENVFKEIMAKKYLYLAQKTPLGYRLMKLSIPQIYKLKETPLRTHHSQTSKT